MDSVLLAKPLPLLGLVGLGFVAGRHFGVERGSVARLAIFVVAPCVFFYGTATAPIDREGTASFLLLPLLTWGLASLVCAIVYALGSRVPRPRRNLMAFAVGNTNSGYFGIPAAVAIFGESAFSTAVLLSIGFTLFENTVGFYVTARGRSTPREALARLLRLPAL